MDFYLFIHLMQKNFKQLEFDLVHYSGYWIYKYYNIGA